MKTVTVYYTENTSQFIMAKKTFKVLKQDKVNKYNIGQHFDLAQFGICAEQGIKVIVLPN